MATDRERAASLYREARNAGPGNGPRVVSMIARALAPTDEEREAVAWLRGRVLRTAEMLESRDDLDDSAADAVTVRQVLAKDLRDALARLDAVTGGRGDG